MKKTNKTTNIILRVTEEDKKYIKEQAALVNMNVSQFILTTAYNKKIVVNNNIPELLLGMTRIGTNINQIAHLCNSQKSVNNNLLDSVLKKQKELEKLMKKILSDICSDEEHTIDSLKKKIDKLTERIDNKHGNS
jgi:uncharacterized protein (DUF1778 family)